MDYESFRERLDGCALKGSYRVLADLERRCGRFPRAYDHRIGTEVTGARTTISDGTAPGGLPKAALKRVLE
jgi:hypothetical protein